MTTKQSRSDLVDDMEDVVNIQASDGNWDADPYMHGMLNGMILMHAMTVGKEPEFKTVPKYWQSRTYRYTILWKYRIRRFFAGLRDYTISNITGLTIDWEGVFRIKPVAQNEEN